MKCKYCGRRHDDQIKCKKKAKDPECGLPDPDCNHDKEHIEDVEGQDSAGISHLVSRYKCTKCGGMWGE